MKRLLFLIMMVFMVAISVAKDHSVKYAYKIFAAEGCEVKYSLSKQDTTYYLIISVTSDRMLFTTEPKIKIRTFDDEVLELEGTPIGNGSESIGIVAGNMVLPVTDIVTNAQFKVGPGTLEKLKSGVKKIRITLSPMNHEREFSKDKIGKKLYKFYEELKSQKDDDF